MKHGKKLLALLLTLALLASLSVCALADEGDGEIVGQTGSGEEPGSGEDGEVVLDGESGKMTVKCVDTEGTVIRDEEADYLDLSKNLVVDDKYSRPELEKYTYRSMRVGSEEISKLTVSHNESGPVITAVTGEGESAAEKTLTGSETLFFVYEKDSGSHVHVWDEGKVTREATCTEAGVKTFSCSCGEKRTEEIPALGHDWGEPTYTWAEDGSCTAARVCSRNASHTETETVKATELITKEPGCTEKGEKTLTATFANSAFAAQTKTVEIPALGHDFAHGRCRRCDAMDPNFKPKLTDKTNGHASWGTNYVVTSDAARKDFQKVLIDGTELPSSDYTVSEKDGNTVVTIKGEAIKRLKVGEHKIAVVSLTGTAERRFTVSDKPKTGDEGVGLWTGLLLFSALGCGAAVVTWRKKAGAQ